MLKNAVTVGNPFSPFANKFFPNPYIRISFESRTANITGPMKA